MNFATENFPWKKAQSCFCSINHVFSFSRKFFNFPFKVGPPPLTLLSTCWSEAPALVKSHDATTQTDRTGEGARLSGPQTGCQLDIPESSLASYEVRFFIAAGNFFVSTLCRYKGNLDLRKGSDQCWRQ